MAMIGFMLMLIGASGIDAPDPTANYILLAVAMVLMLAGTKEKE